MNPVWKSPALSESFFITFDIPSGPNLSINPWSPFFQKKDPIFLEGLTKIKSYNSSMYHLLIKNLYNGKFVFLNPSKIPVFWIK